MARSNHRVLHMLLFILGSLSCGCSSHGGMSSKDVQALNREHIGQLIVGMAKEEVVALMTIDPSRLSASQANPYKTESFQRGADTYEVIYYRTSAAPTFVPVKDKHSTPVVFKNGVLVGWGEGALRGL